MSRFLGTNTYAHTTPQRIGILITNLGTPDAPTPQALRRYLAEFLSDRRVVEIPRLLWLAILHGIILRVRPKKSAAAYQAIWQKEGSPLLSISKRQASAVECTLQNQILAAHSLHRSPEITVALGMRYGNPALSDALETLRQAHCEAILVLPLYPHYSGSTTGSTFDALAKTLMKWRWVPKLHFINHYHDYPLFINACVSRIQAFWEKTAKPDRLILSYHGLPKQFLLSGDPYFCHCHKTSRLISTHLGFPSENIITTFQSRFGKAEWLQPYTDKTLIHLGKEGTDKVHVFCPGFAADCLETLEEIAQENRNYFLENGGKDFQYIPALNDSPTHINALATLIHEHLAPWLSEPARDTAISASQARHFGANV